MSLFKVNYAKWSSGSHCVCPTIRYSQHITKQFISGFQRSTAMPSSGWGMPHDQQVICHTQDGIFRKCFRLSTFNVINKTITKRIKNYIAPTRTFDFEPQCLLQGWACHMVNNFIISHDTHAHTNSYLTILPPARYATWPPSSLFPIFPPRPMRPWPNRLLVSGERTLKDREGGVCQQRKKGQNSNKPKFC
jgi:hypothetical protein